MFLIYKADEDDIPETPRPEPVPDTPRPDPLPETPRPEPTPDEWDDQYSEDPRRSLAHSYVDIPKRAYVHPQ